MDSMLRKRSHGSQLLEAASPVLALTLMASAMGARGIVTMITDGVSAMLDGQGMTARLLRRDLALGDGHQITNHL